MYRPPPPRFPTPLLGLLAALAIAPTILALSILDPASGKRRATVVQPMVGGSGGRP